MKPKKVKKIVRPNKKAIESIDLPIIIKKGLKQVNYYMKRKGKAPLKSSKKIIPL